ncbi:MAG: hypothetical protein HDS86_04300, partial [Bacteroidales bacterium]|nr:hypothetical protein [Bacteroidales bacterium]
MKKLKTLLCGLFAAAMITGCSDEALNNEPGNSSSNNNNGDGVFMSLDIEMPDGNTGFSRSSTINGGGSTGGIEIGKDEENRVSSALIVLASKEAIGTDMSEYGFIAASEVRSNRLVNLSSGNTKQYRATAGIQKENLSNLYALYSENNVIAEDATE